MKKHFVGGFIVEITSKKIMIMFSFFMSSALMFGTWAWVDGEFDWNTLPGTAESYLWVAWILLGGIFIYYPIIGLFCLTIIDKGLKGQGRPEDWVSPFCGIFVGIIAKLFFDYMGGVILDTTDVMFMCWAIDKDNNVDLSECELTFLLKEIPDALFQPNNAPNATPSAPLVTMAIPLHQPAPGQVGSHPNYQQQQQYQQYQLPTQTKNEIV